MNKWYHIVLFFTNFYDLYVQKSVFCINFALIQANIYHGAETTNKQG